MIENPVFMNPRNRACMSSWKSKKCLLTSYLTQPVISIIHSIGINNISICYPRVRARCRAKMMPQSRERDAVDWFVPAEPPLLHPLTQEAHRRSWGINTSVLLSLLLLRAKSFQHVTSVWPSLNGRPTKTYNAQLSKQSANFYQQPNSSADICSRLCTNIRPSETSIFAWFSNWRAPLVCLINQTSNVSGASFSS